MVGCTAGRSGGLLQEMEGKEGSEEVELGGEDSRDYKIRLKSVTILT